MANYVVTDSELTSIADSIRDRTGVGIPLGFPSDFKHAIGRIVVGDSADYSAMSALFSSIDNKYTISNSRITAVGSYVFAHSVIVSVRFDNCIKIGNQRS